MGKSDRHVLDAILLGGVLGKKITETPVEVPPKIPPRMKNKGPDLPAKPAHMRPKKQEDQIRPPCASSQALKENFLMDVRSLSKCQQQVNHRLTNNDRFPNQKSSEREILVAASRAGRERPVEKRQREPAKLLAPTAGSQSDVPLIIHKKEDRLKSSSSKKTSTDPMKTLAVVPARKQPMVLIPRGFLVDNRGAVINQLWASAPVSYAYWMQRDNRPLSKSSNHQETKLTPILSSSTSIKTRSNSVTRSGSLTSQGSSSSDSGNETFPKSVLKKQKRHSGGSLNPKSSQKIEHKKNVTFNAFATVQLMEE